MDYKNIFHNTPMTDVYKGWDSYKNDPTLTTYTKEAAQFQFLCYLRNTQDWKFDSKWGFRMLMYKLPAKYWI